MYYSILSYNYHFFIFLYIYLFIFRRKKCLKMVITNSYNKPFISHKLKNIY